MIRRIATTTALLALTAATAAVAGPTTFDIDKVHSLASFEIRHLVSNVRGQFDDMAGTIVLDPDHPETGSVKLTIQAASINTRVEDRDKHLRSEDFFYVEKYPELTFESTKIEPAGKGQYAVTGNLTMRGVTKQITLPVSYLGQAKDPWGNLRAGFETAITLDRKDYGINWNKALDQGGFLLGDDVKVEVSIEAVAQKPAPPAAPAG
jgi:polyisoprenoid-binding protein YceI